MLPPPWPPLSMLRLALVTWGIAGFFVLTGYGGAIGLPLGLLALWPFGAFLKRQYHVSNLVLVLSLIASAVVFEGVSLLYLSWLVNNGFT